MVMTAEKAIVAENDRKQQKRRDKKRKTTRRKEYESRNRKERKIDKQQAREKRKSEEAEQKRNDLKARKKKVKQEKNDLPGKKKKDTFGKQTPKQALKRVEDRLGKLETRLAESGSGLYTTISDLREYTTKRVEQIKQDIAMLIKGENATLGALDALERKNADNVKADLTLFRSVDSLRSKNADNVRADITIFTSLKSWNDLIKELDSQLKASMTKAVATRRSASTMSRCTQGAVFSNVYTAVVGSAMKMAYGARQQPYDKVSTTTTTSKESDYYDSDSSVETDDSSNAYSSDSCSSGSASNSTDYDSYASCSESENTDMKNRTSNTGCGVSRHFHTNTEYRIQMPQTITSSYHEPSPSEKEAMKILTYNIV